MTGFTGATGLTQLIEDEEEEEKTDRATKNRLDETRKRVEKLTERVKESIHLIMERGDKVDDLHERAYNLLQESFQFKKVTNTLRTRLWGQSRRLLIFCLVGLGIFIILMIVLFTPSGRRLL